MKPKNLLGALAATQAKAVAIQKDISNQTFEGQAQGGLVKAKLTGTGEMKELVLDPSLASEDMDTIAALVVAACNGAYVAKEAYAKEKLKTLGSGLGSLGLGGLVAG